MSFRNFWPIYSDASLCRRRIVLPFGRRAWHREMLVGLSQQKKLTL